jgi:hypothetical protein
MGLGSTHEVGIVGSLEKPSCLVLLSGKISSLRGERKREKRKRKKREKKKKKKRKKKKKKRKESGKTKGFAFPYDPY